MVNNAFHEYWNISQDEVPGNHSFWLRDFEQASSLWLIRNVKTDYFLFPVGYKVYIFQTLESQDRTWIEYECEWDPWREKKSKVSPYDCWSRLSLQDMCCHGDGEQGLNWDGVR